MAKNAHTMHIRLSPELIKKFETFHANNFCGLPASLIGRLLLIDQLEKSEQELVAVVLKHIQGRAPSPKPGTNRTGLDVHKGRNNG